MPGRRGRGVRRRRGFAPRRAVGETVGASTQGARSAAGAGRAAGGVGCAGNGCVPAGWTASGWLAAGGTANGRDGRVGGTVALPSAITTALHRAQRILMILPATVSSDTVYAV